METRARYFVVGLFVLSVSLGVVAFVVWLSAFGSHIQYQPYYVRFAGSVSQLRAESTVLFGGIPVGRVVDVGIDPENSELARVSIEVREGTPIRTDSVANLEVQSLAGGVVMQISRGSRDAGLLSPGSEIKGAPSALERIARQLPDLLGKVDHLANQADRFLSDENAVKVSAILDNLQHLSSQLVDLADGIDETAINQAVKDADTTLLTFKEAADQFKEAAGHVQSLAVNLSKTTTDLKGETTATMNEISAMAQSIAKASDALDAVIADNREPLKQFSGNTLYQAGELVEELRRLVQSLTRISHQIENDPARFLLGDRAKGVEAQ